MKQIFKHRYSEFSVRIDGDKADREVENLLTSKIEEMMLGGTANVPMCLCEIDIWNKLEVQLCDDKIMIWGDDGLVELDRVEPAITITL